MVLLLAALALSLGMVAKAPCLDVAGEGGHRALRRALLVRRLAGVRRPRARRAGLAVHRRRGRPGPLRPGLAAAGPGVRRVGRGPRHPRARRLARPRRAARPAGARTSPPTTRCTARPGSSPRVTAVWLAAAGLLAAGLLVGARRRRPWDAAAFAAAPVLVLLWPITWDLLAAAAVAGGPVGLGAGPAGGGRASRSGSAPRSRRWSRCCWCRSPWSGVRDRRAAQAWRVARVAAGTWLVVNAPAYVSSPAAWRGVVAGLPARRRRRLGVAAGRSRPATPTSPGRRC